MNEQLLSLATQFMAFFKTLYGLRETLYGLEETPHMAGFKSPLWQGGNSIYGLFLIMVTAKI